MNKILTKIHLIKIIAKNRTKILIIFSFVKKYYLLLQQKTKIKPKFMKRIFLILFLSLILQLFTINCSCSQNRDGLRVAFWNLENFFDPFVDSARVYNEYTEEGTQHWTMSRFYRKRNNLYKTILSISKGKALAIIGLCEVENTFVTTMLFHETPLKRHNYKVIHYEGDDRRGIDVALVYSIDKLQLIYSEAVKIRGPNNRNIKTRDILYAKFYDRVGDTLHCFVNHWPSRYGGEKETIFLRELAARRLKSKVDSLVTCCDDFPKIVIMGDFNDTPCDNSILNVLKAKPPEEFTDKDTLVNLFADDKRLGFEGTLKHQYRWQIFDQIIISRSLYDSKSLHYVMKSATILHEDFLFVEDASYGGKKLFRTYVGPKYYGGYSDHLPVYIDLK